MSDGLSDAIDRFLRTPFPAVLFARATPALAEVVQRINVRESVGPRPTPVDIATSCRRIDELIDRGLPLERRDLRIAPWCLWAPERPLADRPGRLEAILRQIEAAARGRLYRILALAWGHAYDSQRVGIAEVGRFLTAHAADLGPGWLAALKRWPLFDPLNGPRALGAASLEVGKAPEEVLGEFGLPSFAACVPYALAAHRQAIRGAERLPADRRLNVLRRISQTADGGLRHMALGPDVVTAAIEPFGAVLPDRTTRDEYTRFALALLGDPRSQAFRWVNCQTAQDIMRRWLTEQTLRQFFDVVDAVAFERHWIYRRAFWNALYRRDLIDEAWVVFETRGQHVARDLFGRDFEFGAFSNGNVQAGHAVLLLKVGTLTVAEWSHSSPCSIWDLEKDENPPLLYKKSYEADSLKKKYNPLDIDDDMKKHGLFWHRGSKNYTWQKNISDFLKARRRIDLKETEYRVQDVI